MFFFSCVAYLRRCAPIEMAEKLAIRSGTKEGARKVFHRLWDIVAPRNSMLREKFMIQSFEISFSHGRVLLLVLLLLLICCFLCCCCCCCCCYCCWWFWCCGRYCWSCHWRLMGCLSRWRYDADDNDLVFRLFRRNCAWNTEKVKKDWNSSEKKRILPRPSHNVRIHFDSPPSVPQKSPQEIVAKWKEAFLLSLHFPYFPMPKTSLFFLQWIDIQMYFLFSTCYIIAPSPSILFQKFFCW